MNRSEPRHWLVLWITVVVYAVVSINHLAAFPPVGEDEPWIAAAPFKLAAQGVYGSDLFAGYHGMDRHNFDHMPLYPLFEAGVFKLLGAGTFQMRLLPVSLGLVLLLLVAAVGWQLGGPGVGTLAAALMIGMRTTRAD